MRAWAILFCCCLAAMRGQAQMAAPVQSVTRQFTAVLVGPPVATFPAPKLQPIQGGFLISSPPPSVSSPQAALDPALLVISAERIKQSLLMTLGLPDQWRGQIHVFINPARREEEGTLLAGLHGGAAAWNYDLILPARIKPDLLLRAVVKALLTEMANRRAGEQSAEIPDWLVAGLSARLQADAFQTLVLQPQVTTLTERVSFTGLSAVRQKLQGRLPLTFQQLSLPEPELESDANYDYFAANSQLFLEQLLRLDDGPGCLREWVLAQLPGHLNWQTAFLAAYSRHFGQLLDVEKWWSLACVSFTETDARALFSADDTWRKMQETLDVPVEVRLSADSLPVPAELTLQEVIAEWIPAQAAPVLQRAAEGLALLRMRSAVEYAPLLDQYRAVIQSYLSDTSPDRPAWTSVHQATLLASVRYSACQDLTRLDRQRAALRPRSLAPGVSGRLQNPASPLPAPSAESVNRPLP